MTALSVSYFPPLFAIFFQARFLQKCNLEIALNSENWQRLFWRLNDPLKAYLHVGLISH